MRKNKIFQLDKIKITKKYKLNSLKKFLLNIKEDEFKISRSIKNIPWKFLGVNKFHFYFVYFENKIIGNITILNNTFNKHLYFLYIDKNFRNKGIGNFLIKKIFIKNKKLKTIHVLKTLKNTIKFYKKFSFIKSKKIESENVIRWVNKCNKYDKSTFRDKYLIIRDF
mgnify:CR=1 FL=1|tara:strand:+ start:988 stop:1488 length:501 start_codon:yes stop_codon:yes gene_type:complete